MDFQPRKVVFASNLLEELLLSFPELSIGFPSVISWRAHASKIITALQMRLCPIVNYGETLIPLIKHLLFNAKVRVELSLLFRLDCGDTQIVQMPCTERFFWYRTGEVDPERVSKSRRQKTETRLRGRFLVAGGFERPLYLCFPRFCIFKVRAALLA